MKTPYLAYPLDQPWLLTIEELVEAGVQSLKTNFVHQQQKGAPLQIPGWNGPVLMTSGLVEAEIAGIATKWLPEGPTIQNPESGQWTTLIESPRLDRGAHQAQKELDPAVKPRGFASITQRRGFASITQQRGFASAVGLSEGCVTIIQPPIFSHTSQTKRKSLLALAKAWKNAMTGAPIIECCIQGDPALLQKFLDQQQPYSSIASWQPLGSIKLPDSIHQWHLGIHSWEDFLVRLEEGADILTTEFLPEYTLAGRILTRDGWIDLTQDNLEFNQEPLAQDCTCTSCRDYTRSYLHHLWQNTPLLAQRILAKHNVFYLESWMQRLRNAEETGKFTAFGKLS